MLPVPLALLVLAFGPADGAPQSPDRPGDPARGYAVLRNKPLLPPDFDRETLLKLGVTWPADLRAQAKAADETGRLALAFSRYGFVAPRRGIRSAGRC